MSRNACLAAFLAGGAAIVWVAAGYGIAHPLALAVTVAIAAVYGLGALEMSRFRRATEALAAALAALPPDLPRLEDWLERVPPSLRDAVRLRVEGARQALPGPALTPYLAALLVMLGMLGTFLGMVVTLNGAVLALESTTDLPTIRAALAAPVKGLGLAFGTSVAGVAASAMLGLVSVLCRRDRQRVARQLDGRIATVLRPFSAAHQRQQSLAALQLQATLLPGVAGQLQTLIEAIDRRSQQLDDRLLARQDGLLQEVRGAYRELAVALDRSLADSLTASVRAAGEAVRPVVEATMAGIAGEAAALQQRTADLLEGRLTGLSARLAEESAARDRQRQAQLAESLTALATSLGSEWRQAGAQTLAQQERICATLERTAREITGQSRAQAQETIGEIGRLLEAAAAAPRAAAQLVEELRQEAARSHARDNEVFEERRRTLASLQGLLQGVEQAADGQRQVVEALISSSAATLDRSAGRFAETVGAEAGRLEQLAAQVAAGAAEVGSLGEAFGHGVRLFGDGNDRLVASLQQIEAALERSAARSDEQLAYYVAQAREIIDLSLLSQKQVMDELHRLAGRRPVASEAC